MNRRKRKRNRLRATIFAAALNSPRMLFLLICAGVGACSPALADVVGQPQTRSDFDSYRVRRIALHTKGHWEKPELAISGQKMLPLDVILQLRRKRYEIVAEPTKEYPVAGILSVLYEVTHKAKTDKKEAGKKGKNGGDKLEITLQGRVLLRAVQQNVVLWQVDSSTTEVIDSSGDLPDDVVEKLISGFYKGVFTSLPPVPKFKLVVGAPYEFPALLTREPVRPPRDTISVGRIVRGILKERWEGAPAPLHHVADGGGDPIVQIWNDSDQQLTVCYQGSTDTDLILAPDAKMAFRMAAGPYRVAARTADSTIVPLYGTEELKSNCVYSIRFAVSEEGY